MKQLSTEIEILVRFNLSVDSDQIKKYDSPYLCLDAKSVFLRDTQTNEEIPAKVNEFETMDCQILS